MSEAKKNMKLRASVLLLFVLGGSLPFILGFIGKHEGSKDRDNLPGESKDRDAAGEGEFRLPGDSGGQLVGRLLAPPERLPDGRPAPKRKPGMKGLENPRMSLPEPMASLPRLPEGPRRSI